MKTSQVLFEVHLDSYLPLKQGKTSFLSSQYILEPLQITMDCAHVKSETCNFGSSNIKGNLGVQPMGESAGNLTTSVNVYYTLPSYRCIEDYNAAFNSDMWQLSIAGLDFLIADLNRVIDLYRMGGFPNYLANYLSTFSINELSIFSIGANGNRSFLSTCWPKTLGPITHVREGVLAAGHEVPFYYRLYLNSWRHFALGQFQEMQIAAANSLEAASRVIFEIAQALSINNFGIPQNNPHARMNKAGGPLAMAGFRPSKKYDLKVARKVVWDKRNRAMHGDYADICRDEAARIHDSLSELVN